jgi:hypothetical protein
VESLSDYTAVSLSLVVEAILPNNAGKGVRESSSSPGIACGELGFLDGKHIGRILEKRNDHGSPDMMISELEYENDHLRAGLLLAIWNS